MTRPIDRRAFMHRATGAGRRSQPVARGALTRNVLGANDRVRIGAIGMAARRSPT
jgi:hypothetical protein